MQVNNQKINFYSINAESLNALTCRPKNSRTLATMLVREVFDVNVLPRNSSSAFSPGPKPKGGPDVLQSASKKRFTLHAELVVRFFCQSAIMSSTCVVLVAFMSPLLHFPMIFRVVFQSSGQHRKLSLIAEPTRRLVMCKMLLSNFGIYIQGVEIYL